MVNLCVGLDPEFFLTNNHGEYKSAIGVVNGTKTEKIDLGNGNLLFYDNVLAEVNIKPGSCADELVSNINGCLKRLIKAVYPYHPILQASATFPVSECKHPDANVFGCEAEYCAYQMNIVQAPECKTTFRSAGGHIHLGYEEGHWPLTASPDDDGGLSRAWGRIWVVRMMDLFLGIPSLWIDQDPSSPARRKLYGKAGTHRPKDYGVEYRATSNFWLRSPKTVKLIYNICEFVVNFVAANKHKELWEDENTCIGYNVQTMCDSINNSDKKAASFFLNNLVKKYMPADLYAQVLTASEPLNGNLNFYREWGLA